MPVGGTVAMGGEHVLIAGWQAGWLGGPGGLVGRWAGWRGSDRQALLRTNIWRQRARQREGERELESQQCAYGSI